MKIFTNIFLAISLGARLQVLGLAFYGKVPMKCKTLGYFIFELIYQVWISDMLMYIKNAKRQDAKLKNT